MERIDVGYGAQERFLHEIVRAVDEYRFRFARLLLSSMLISRPLI